MPLDKIVLIIVCVIAAAALTVWLGAFIAATWQFPGVGWIAVLPVLLIGYIGWRVIAERLSNREDDHYDKIEK